MLALTEHVLQWMPSANVTACDCCHEFMVFAVEHPDSIVLHIYRFGSTFANNRHPLELFDHKSTIECIRVRRLDDVLLICSASKDRVIAWQLAFDGTILNRTMLMKDASAPPSSIVFDATSSMVAIAVHCNVQVMALSTCSVYASIEGHIAPVTDCMFHPTRPHLLVTISEDRTFKMWDLASRDLLFQSSVLSAFAILSIACNPINGDAILGFADGTIKIFKVEDTHGREIMTLDMDLFNRRRVRKQRQEELRERILQEPAVLSSLAPWEQSEAAQRTAKLQSILSNPAAVDDPDIVGDDVVSLPSCPILALHCIARQGVYSNNQREDKLHEFNGYYEEQLVDSEQIIVIGTPAYLFTVNALSYDIELSHEWQLPFPSKQLTKKRSSAIGAAKQFSFYTWQNQLSFSIVSAFRPCVTHVDVIVQPSEPSNETPSRLSVLPLQPPPAGSILLLPPLKAPSPASSTSSSPSKTSKSSSIVNRPVTFHSRVKSSGYGDDVPFSVRKKRASSRSAPKSPVQNYLREYPTTCHPLTHFQPKHALPKDRKLHRGAILQLEYSPDTKWIGLCGSDSVAQVCKLPFSRFQGEGNILAEHDQAVRSLHWSQTSKQVLTTSSDGSAKLWVAESDCSSLTLKGDVPARVAGVAYSSKKNVICPPVLDAQFFYMDKFVASISGSTLRLHQCYVDEKYAHRMTSLHKQKRKKSNDIDVEINRSRKKKVAQFSIDSAQKLTAVACINGGFLSPLLVVTASDRSMHLIDMAADRVARTVTDIHSRAAHAISMPQPSVFTSHAPNLYDLLLTSAPDSSVNVWDVRADNCVLKCAEHVNRVHPLRPVFSPCMRYIAIGSEERHAYLYDIRTGRSLHKLPGHTDVVTSVAFHPLHPQLATCSSDGSVRFYSDKV